MKVNLSINTHISVLRKVLIILLVVVFSIECAGAEFAFAAGSWRSEAAAANDSAVLRVASADNEEEDDEEWEDGEEGEDDGEIDDEEGNDDSEGEEEEIDDSEPEGEEEEQTDEEEISVQLTAETLYFDEVGEKKEIPYTVAPGMEKDQIEIHCHCRMSDLVVSYSDGYLTSMSPGTATVYLSFFYKGERICDKDLTVNVSDLCIYIGQEHVTKENTRGAGWQYDIKSRTLKLKNFHYEGTGRTFRNDRRAGIYVDYGVTIELEGNSSITVADGGACNYGIYSRGCISFKGNGVLSVQAGNTDEEKEDTHSCAIYCGEWMDVNEEATLRLSGAMAKYSNGIDAYLVNISGKADVTCIADIRASVAEAFVFFSYYIEDDAHLVTEYTHRDERLYRDMIDKAISTGVCGKNMKWAYTENGVLIIYGKGRMDDYTARGTVGQAPWGFLNKPINEIAVLDGVTYIGTRAFTPCGVNLIGTARYGTGRIYLADSVEEIGDYAFQGVDSGCYETLRLPVRLHSIGEGAFEDCGLIKGELVFPERLEHLGNGAFENCRKLRSVVARYNITTLPEFTFAGCDDLCKVEFSGGLKTIERSAFRSSGIRELSLPSTLRTIEDTAFARCRDLDEIRFGGDAPVISDSAFNGCDDSLVLLYAPETAGWMSPVWNGRKAYPIHIHDVAGERVKGATTEEDGRIDKVCSVCGCRTSRTVIPSIDAESVTVTSGLVYNGKAQVPMVRVCDRKGQILISEQDYSLVCRDNIAAGTGTVEIRFKGRYSGSVIRSFEIKAANIQSAALALSTTVFTYDGKKKEPIITSAGLSRGNDYTITYENNVNAGKATAVVTGQGNYTGTVRLPFTIKAAAITGWKITLSATALAYTGKIRKPSVTVSGIAAGNYGLSYSNANSTNVGPYSVTVTGKGNYTGSRKFSYQIIPKATTVSSLSALSKGFKAKWKKVSAQVTGYQLQYSKSSGFASGNKTVKITSCKTTSKKVTGLSAKKKYYVRIRTYKTVGSNTYYSSWSAAKTVKTKS